MGVSDHKCLACNASLKFDPKSQKWICDYCGSEFTLKDFRDEKGKKKNVRISKNKGYMEYCCPDCGAKIVMNENTAATECVYCGNSAIILDHLEGEFKPNRVIPFKLTKEDAIAAYGKHTKRKKFMPKAFSDRKNIEKVTGIYVPFYLFDMKVNGYLNAEGVHVTKWINGNYRVVKSEYYDVVRDGIMFFDKIPTDASKKMGDDIMDSIEPYNYEDLTRFDISYMSGFVAEKYDLDDNELVNRASGRAKESAKKLLLDSVEGYSTKTLKAYDEDVFVNGKPEYVMLPVWLLNIKYEGKMYTMAMNGQTGKFVGNVPISKRKVAAYWFSITAVISLIICILSFISVVVGVI